MNAGRDDVLSLIAASAGRAILDGDKAFHNDLMTALAAVAELIDIANAARKFLRSDEWNYCDYMEGQEIDIDRETCAKSIDAALAHCGVQA